VAGNLTEANRLVRAQSGLLCSHRPQLLGGDRQDSKRSLVRHAEQQRHIQFAVVEPLAQVPGEGGIQAQFKVRRGPADGSHQRF